jgi:transposase
MSKSGSDNTSHEMIETANKMCEQLQKFYTDNKILKEEIVKSNRKNKILEEALAEKEEALAEKEEALADRLKFCLKLNTQIKELKKQLEDKSKLISKSDSDNESDSDSDSESDRVAKSKPKKK